MEISKTYINNYLKIIILQLILLIKQSLRELLEFNNHATDRYGLG